MMRRSRSPFAHETFDSVRYEQSCTCCRGAALPGMYDTRDEGLWRVAVRAEEQQRQSSLCVANSDVCSSS